MSKNKKQNEETEIEVLPEETAEIENDNDPGPTDAQASQPTAR